MGVKNDKALLADTTKVELWIFVAIWFAVVMLMSVQMLYLYDSIARKFVRNLIFRSFH